MKINDKHSYSPCKGCGMIMHEIDVFRYYNGKYIHLVQKSKEHFLEFVIGVLPVVDERRL